MNDSALTALIRQTNTYAAVRDYLVSFTSDLAVTTANSVKMQASSLSQLTQATNQLTRSTSVNLLDLLHSISRIPPIQMIASNKCNQLASALVSMTTAVPYEDVQSAATHIAQCAMNALTVSVMPSCRDRRSRSNPLVGGE